MRTGIPLFYRHAEFFLTQSFTLRIMIVKEDRQMTIPDRKPGMNPQQCSSSGAG